VLVTRRRLSPGVTQAFWGRDAAPESGKVYQPNRLEFSIVPPIGPPGPPAGSLDQEPFSPINMVNGRLRLFLGRSAEAGALLL
jgi:hypothetical protein